MRQQFHSEKAKKILEDDIEPKIDDIEAKLDHPDHGLAALKVLLDDLELKLDNIEPEVDAIEAKLDDPVYGLAQLQLEIDAIEDKLDSPIFGLAQLQLEIDAIEDKLDDPVFGLAAIETLVDDLETRLTALRAGYLDRLANRVQTRNFWSDIDDVILLTAAASDDNLPNVVLPNIPGTITAVYVGIKIRMIENTASTGANAINGANLKVRIKDSLGAWGVDDVVAIDLTDNMWEVAASSREGGDVVVGDNDVSGEMNAFNATYNIRFEDNQVDLDNLQLNDVQAFLIVSYY